MANFNFNKVILGGRLTADPELKTTTSGVSVASFGIAVNRRYGGKDQEPQTDFFKVTAYRQTAEFVTKFFRKASSICIMGSIQTRSWVDQQGMKRFATEIVADEAYFVDAKTEAPAAAMPAAAQTYAPQYAQQNPPQYAQQNDAYTPPPVAPQFEELSDSDELPF